MQVSVSQILIFLVLVLVFILYQETGNIIFYITLNKN